MIPAQDVTMGNGLEQLRQALEELDRIPDSEWLGSLDERKRKELEFHDRFRDKDAAAALPQDTFEKVYGNAKYYRKAKRVMRYSEAWLERHVPGKVFLDLACGNGLFAFKAARAGARYVIGLDISRVSVEIARQEALAAGLADRTFFLQADAERTLLPSSSVDVCVCSGMLHHLDLTYVVPELRRILKPGGRVLAIEALDYNPAIKLYRKLTPGMRTEWERSHILGLGDLKFMGRFLDVGEVRYFFILSILSPHLPLIAPALDAVDRVIERVPLLRLLAWMFTFELVKRPLTTEGRTGEPA